MDGMAERCDFFMGGRGIRDLSMCVREESGELVDETIVLLGGGGEH